MSLFFNFRIRGPTASELAVIHWLLFWGFFVAFIGLGVVCLFLGYRAPPEKAADAARAIHYGYGSIALGGALYLVRRYCCGYSSDRW